MHKFWRERISFGFGYTAVRAFTIWKAVWELNLDFLLKPNWIVWSCHSVQFRRNFNEFDKMSTNSAIDVDFYVKIIEKFLKILQNPIKNNQPNQLNIIETLSFFIHLNSGHFIECFFFQLYTNIKKSQNKLSTKNYSFWKHNSKEHKRM